MLASLLSVVVGLTIASPVVLASDQVVRGPAKVLDGDTIVVARQHVRLLGIDAPEDGQTCRAAGQDWPCGDDASTALSKLTADREVVCRAPARDRYRRLLGTCFVGERTSTPRWCGSATPCPGFHAAAYPAPTTAPRLSRPASRAGACGAATSLSPGSGDTSGADRSAGLGATTRGANLVRRVRRPD